MDLKQLEAFAAIVSCGSFSSAAGALYLTQPTISAHLKTLETELGTLLIVRAGRTAYPTPAGQTLYNYATQIIKLEKEARAAVKGNASVNKTVITIAASSLPAQYILPSAVSLYRRTHPDIGFNIISCDSAAAAIKIASGEAELGFTGADTGNKQCEYTPFTKDELILITPNCPSYSSFKNAWDIIKASPVIMREVGSGTRQCFERFVLINGGFPQELNLAAVMRDTEAIKRMSAEGMGVSVISRSAAEDYLKIGKIKAFPLGDKGTWRSIYVVTKKKRELCSGAKDFAEYIKAHYKL